jgi:predicted ATP-grasp superfamily ATP-dependent carboligase
LLYTGGLENYPTVVAQLAKARPLFGNPPEVLERVRDPYFLRTITAAPARTPRLIPASTPAPLEGSWLRKPHRSSGGHGIRFAAAREPASPHHSFQEFVDGPALSAQFLSTFPAADGSGQTHLLGITEQLIGEPWLHAPGFAYCGNVGPIALPEAVVDALEPLGRDLSAATSLRGLWGLDFILKDHLPYLLEVNPRYTAAIEVLELGTRLSALSLHINCFNRIEELCPFEPASGLTTPVGKAVYYAPHPILFPSSGPWDRDLEAPFDPWRIPGCADIPEAGATIERSQPVLTLLTGGSSPQACRDQLQSRAAELDRLFAESTP